MLSRLKSRVLIVGKCWLWLGPLDRQGYVRVWYKGKNTRAHIVTRELVFGPAPENTVLDHTCRTRHCISPHCTEPVTSRENTRRGESFAGQKARQTHCVRGHELAGENLLVRADRPGRRECRACKAERRKKNFSAELRALLPDDWMEGRP